MEIVNCFGRRKGRKLHHNKGGKWEVGTRRGLSVKDIEGVFEDLYLMQIFRNRFQSTCLALMGLEELRLR